MNNFNEGFSAIKNRIEEAADLCFENSYTLAPSQKDSRCTLFRLFLESGEIIDLTLSCVQIGLYLSHPQTKETIDGWIKKRLEAVEHPQVKSVRRAS